MPYRVSFFKQQQSTLLGGWSENFWNNANDLAAARAAATDMWQALQLMSAVQIKLTSYRISAVGPTNFRNVDNHPITISGSGSVTAGNDADYPTTKLLLKLKAAGNYSVKQWLGGLPDAIISDSGTYQPTPTFVTRFNKFAALLTNATKTWSLNVLDRAIPKKIVTAISQAGVVTIVNHGYNSGDRVRITGAKNLTQANAVWIVTRIDADTFSLNYWIVPAVSTPLQGKPTARLQSYILVQVSSVEVVRVTSHKVGRPSGLLGGRRRKRAS